MKFDIGNVYEKRGQLFLAVQENRLLSCDYDGNFQEFTTAKKHSHNGDIPIGDLCEVWDVTIAELDARVRKYFAPDPAAQVKARKKLKRDDEVGITPIDSDLN